MINFSPEYSHSILGSEDTEMSLEDDERTLTMVKDLCSEDVAGNASSLLHAPLADDGMHWQYQGIPLTKVGKLTKKRSLLNWRKLWHSLLLFMLTRVNVLPFNKSCVCWFQKTSCLNLPVITVNLLSMTTYVAGN